jgi:hypothetical protein
VGAWAQRSSYDFCRLQVCGNYQTGAAEIKTYCLPGFRAGFAVEERAL